MAKSPSSLNLDALLEHGGWVRALARSLVSDAATAEDVEQKSWLAAIEHPPKHGSNLRSWLGGVVRNKAAMQWREDQARRRREKVVSENRWAEESRNVVELRPENVAERKETFRKMAMALADMDEPYGMTLFLRFLEELTMREIAERMGVSESTVKARVNKGLRILRKRLASEMGEDWRSRCLVFTVPLATTPVGGLATALAMTTTTKLTVTAAVIVLALILILKPWTGQVGAESFVGIQAEATLVNHQAARNVDIEDVQISRSAHGSTDQLEMPPPDLEMVDHDGNPIPNAVFISLLTNERLVSRADGGVVRERSIKAKNNPYLIWAPGYSPIRVHRLDRIIVLKPATQFRAKFVDSETGNGVQGISIRPFVPHRVSRLNAFHFLDSEIPGGSKNVGLRSVSSESGVCELKCPIVESSFRLEIVYEDGVTELLSPHQLMEYDQLSDGTWVIPVNAEFDSGLSLQFVWKESYDPVAGKSVVLWRNGLRDYLTTNTSGVVPLISSRVGRGKILEWPASSSLIQLDDNFFWLEAWPWNNDPRDLPDDVTVVVEVNPIPIWVSVKYLEPGFEVGVAAMSSSTGVEWPDTNADVVWVPCNLEGETILDKGYFGPKVKVMLRHAASGTVVDTAIAKCGDQVSLDCIALGQLSVSSFKGSQPLPVDWRLRPWGGGALFGKGKNRLQDIRFNASKEEIELPVGKYAVWAHWDDVLVYQAIVEVSSLHESIVANIGEKAGLQKVVVSGSLSGPIAFATVESVGDGGQVMDSSITDFNGVAELFFDWSQTSRLRVLWPAGTVNRLGSKHPDYKFSWPITRSEEAADFEVQESAVEIQVFGTEATVHVIVGHDALGDEDAKQYFELRINSKAQLVLPMGAGRTYPKYSDNERLSSDFDNSAGGLAICELDFTYFSPWHLRLQVEGGGRFTGEIKTTAKIEGGTEVLSGLNGSRPNGIPFSLIGASTGEFSLSIKGSIWFDEKQWPVSFVKDISLFKAGEERVLRLSVVNSEVVAELIVAD